MGYVGMEGCWTTEQDVVICYLVVRVSVCVMGYVGMEGCWRTEQDVVCYLAAEERLCAMGYGSMEGYASVCKSYFEVVCNMVAE